MKIMEAAAQLREIREMHSSFKLCGEPRNALLDVPDNILLYVLSLLRKESPILPNANESQWFHLISILKPHRILPLLYCQIGSLPKELRPPENITNQLREIFRISWMQSQQREQQLKEIISAFKKENIHALVLKGSAIARMVYPDPAMRPSDDIDLLVLPQTMLNARDVMERLGYKCEAKIFETLKDTQFEEHFVYLNGCMGKMEPHTHDTIPVTSAINGATSAEAFTPVYLSGGTPVQTDARDTLRRRTDVEIHWNLHRFYGAKQNIVIDDLFRNEIILNISSFSFETLNLIDTLVHTLLHIGFSHSNDVRLIWIYDIASLVQHLKNPEDWKILQKRSIEYGARLLLEKFLNIAVIWTGLKIPDKFCNFSDWPNPSKNEIAVWPHITQRHENAISALRLRIPDNLSFLKKILLLFHITFPTISHIRKDFPYKYKWQIPLSYIKYWLKWLVKVF